MPNDESRALYIETICARCIELYGDGLDDCEHCDPERLTIEEIEADSE